MKLFFFKAICICFFVLLTTNIIAQDYFGYSNFGGITSVVSNPANIAASRYKFNLNLISTNFYIGSNMYELDNKKFFNFNFDGLQEGKDYNKIDNGETKHFTANVEFLGPSFMFNLNKKTAIGITSRLRTMMNFDNLSNNSFNILASTTPNNNLYENNYTESNVNYNLHSFAELGFTFAKQVFKSEKRDLKLGVTIKYVKGIGGGSVNINKLDILNLKNADTISKIYGNFNVGYSANTQGLLSGDMSSGFSNFGNSDGSSCLATDIGLVYEYRNNKKYPYQWRLGLSITDLSLSNLTYKNGSQGGNYIINNNHLQNISTATISQHNGQTYEQYLQSLESQSFITVVRNDSAKDFSMNLPTALHINADFHVYKALYLNTYILMNLLEANKMGNCYYTSTYIVSPRYDKKWFSLFSPFSYNSLSEFNWGVGVKLGPLFVGSGSVISNLIKDKVHNTDLKLGLAIPFFRSYKSTQKD